MAHRFQHLTEIFLSIFSVVLASATKLLADVPVTAQGQQPAGPLHWFLLPLIGAMLAAGGAFALNPSLEERRIVVGRCIYAVVFGVCVPKLISMIHPALQTLYIDPLVLALFGFAVATVAYILARPFVERSYARSDADAEDLVGEVEKRLRGDKSNPENKP